MSLPAHLPLPRAKGPAQTLSSVGSRTDPRHSSVPRFRNGLHPMKMGPWAGSARHVLTWQRSSALTHLNPTLGVRLLSASCQLTHAWKLSPVKCHHWQTHMARTIYITTLNVLPYFECLCLHRSKHGCHISCMPCRRQHTYSSPTTSTISIHWSISGLWKQNRDF